jgi:hypothetical protein
MCTIRFSWKKISYVACVEKQISQQSIISIYQLSTCPCHTNNTIETTNAKLKKTNIKGAIDAYICTRQRTFSCLRVSLQFILLYLEALKVAKKHVQHTE